MRTLMFLVLIVGLPFAASAQRFRVDSIVAPLDTMAADFSEFLVQLAWVNQPENAILFKEVENATLEASNVSSEWMRDVGVSFFINEANIEGQSTDGNVFYPRWNVGITVNPYNLVTQSKKTKIAKNKIEISELERQDRMLVVRRETLIAYQKLVAAHEALSFRLMFENESKSNYEVVKALYQKDEATFQEYSAASSSYLQAQDLRIKADTDLLSSKYSLESIIGVRWENVRHPRKTPE